MTLLLVATSRLFFFRDQGLDTTPRGKFNDQVLEVIGAWRDGRSSSAATRTKVVISHERIRAASRACGASCALTAG